MNNLFCKLKQDYIVDNYIIKDRQISFGETVDGKFFGIEYLNVDTKKQIMDDIIPNEYHKFFFITLMRINREIPPHTDSDIKTTINLYIETENCVTKFYRFKNNSPQTKQVENQSNGFIFDMEDLEETGSFISKPNEGWVLDVTQPHSVIPQSRFKERLAIAISTELQYDVVCDILKDKGHL
jgi:hypothetical protein